MVTYPTPEPEKAQLRDRFREKGLVLGVKQSEDHSGYDSFVIPNDARPISHEARTEVAGGYTYSDEMLFSDLGRLLGTLAAAGGERPLVLDEEIGRNVAIMEFTKPNEPKILLVPGFETQTKTVGGAEQALECYGRRLYDEFDTQFDRHAAEFIEGFNRADA